MSRAVPCLLIALAAFAADPVRQIQDLERWLETARDNDRPRAQGRVLYRLGKATKTYGDYGAAVKHLEEAALYASRTSDRGALARVLMNLARVQLRQGRLDLSCQAYQRALSIFEELNETAGVILARQEMGAAFAMLGDTKRGLELSQQALDMTGDFAVLPVIKRRQIGLALTYNEAGLHWDAVEVIGDVLREFPRNPPLGAHWILSASYFHLGMYEDSQRAAQQGVDRALRASAVDHEIHSRWWLARALDQLDRNPEAADNMLEALRLVEAVRRRLTPEDAFKRSFAERSQTLTSDAIAVLWNAGRIQEALEAAERARARAFLDLMASRDLPGLSSPPAAPIRAEEDALRLESPASRPPTTANTLVELAVRLDSHVLAYWVHAEALYIWLVAPSGELHARKVPVREERLNHWIERARRDAEKPDRKAWRTLHRWLIEPVRNRLPKKPGAELTVVPHGPLFQLPFAALVGPSGRYLIEDFALRMLPGAALLDLTGPSQARPPRFLLVGAPRSLPGARHEIEQIASGSSRDSVTVLAGRNASRDRVLASVPDATVIHFATHAVLDPAQPFGSYLRLHDADRLAARDIYDLRLNADLVMLAACKSGSGTTSADGLLGLARAFFYAGARSVIAPLWDVADHPSMLLMIEFYSQYRKGQGKASALRAAQLRLLRDLKAGRVEAPTPAGPMILPEQPWLWAGFVLQGAD